MELITEKPVKQFDTSAIAKGNLIYAKHSSWDAGKSGFVTGVNGNEIAGHWECDESFFYPGIRGSRRAMGNPMVCGYVRSI